MSDMSLRQQIAAIARPFSESSLSAADVHLWQASLDCADSEIPAYRSLLSPDECQRADRFLRPIDRLRFTVARGVLRLLLSAYLQVPAVEIQLHYSDRGKPTVQQRLPTGGQLQFNLSHSAGIALYAVTCGRRIGVDLEELRPMADAEQLVKRFYTTQEYAEFCQLPQAERTAAFFRGWTAKEAYLKATGQGVAHLSDVEFSLTPPLRLLQILAGTEAIENWSVNSLELDSQFIGAIAVEGQGWHLKRINLSIVR